MWRVAFALFALTGAAHANSTCRQPQSSKSASLRAIEIVKRLPELAGWIRSDATLLDTGSRQDIGVDATKPSLSFQSFQLETSIFDMFSRFIFPRRPS